MGTSQKSMCQTRRLCVGILVIIASVLPAQEFANLKGKVVGNTAKGTTSVAGARVQIMDPKAGAKKKVWKATTANEGAQYEIDNVAEGKYDIVACDDLFAWQAARQTIDIRHGGSPVNFQLDRSDPANPLPIQVQKAQVIYLKHIETGCELAAIKANDHGVAYIPHLDQSTYEAAFVKCVDDTEEQSGSPFESCLKKRIPVGVDDRQVIKIMSAKPDKIVKSGNNKRIYVYKDVKITFADGKVVEVRPEIEPQTCLLGIGCSNN